MMQGLISWALEGPDMCEHDWQGSLVPFLVVVQALPQVGGSGPTY